MDIAWRPWRRKLSTLLFSAVLAALWSPAWAAPPDSLSVTMPVVEISAARIDRQALLDRQPGFVSVFERDDWSDGGRSASELLARAAGIHVRDRGGLGRYSSVSSRGSASNRVAVYLDGMPLTGPHRGSFDFSQIDLNHLERIEVHRGAAPLQLGGGSLGGAIHLFSANSQPASLSLSSASHGEYSLHAASGRELLGWSTHGSLEIHRGEGDWKHLDDNGTQYNTEDDVWRRRTNNEVASESVLLTASRPLGSWKFLLSEQWRDHRRGEPGLNWNPAREAREKMRSSQSRAALESSLSAMRHLRLIELTHRFEAQGFRDLEGSFGFPADRTDRIHSVSLASEGALRRLGPRVWRAELRQSAMRSEDEAQEHGKGEIQRSGSAALAAQPSFGIGGGWRVSPGARTELRWERFHSTPATSVLPTGEVEHDREWSSQFQLGLLRRGENVDWRFNVARAERVPTLLERFGSRGGVVGNDELRVETGWLRDAGVVFRGEATRLEVIYFDNAYDDLIGFLPVASNKVKAMNVAAAVSRGVELSFGWTAAEQFRQELTLTGLRTEDRSGDALFDGKRLVGEPSYELQHRSSLDAGPWTLSYELTAFGESYLERGERNRLSSRALHAVGLSRRIASLRAQLRVSNLGDREYTDFWGYPMPGRTFRFSLDWRSTT